MKATKKGFEAMAIRMWNAEVAFVETVCRITGITETQAKKVLAVYLKVKVIKLDAVNGVYKIKHGAFYEADVIMRAVNS